MHEGHTCLRYMGSFGHKTLKPTKLWGTACWPQTTPTKKQLLDIMMVLILQFGLLFHAYDEVVLGLVTIMKTSLNYLDSLFPVAC